MGLPEINIRRMFGCDGFFARDTIFGLIWKTGRIGLRFPEPRAFEEAMSLRGSDPWAAGAKIMSHWVLLPESLHREPSTLHSWAQRAHALALSAPAVKPPKKLVRKAPKSKGGL
jgi:TfoX/Sxy family transcriptional regulator of competence genes